MIYTRQRGVKGLTLLNTKGVYMYRLEGVRVSKRGVRLLAPLLILQRKLGMGKGTNPSVL